MRIALIQAKQILFSRYFWCDFLERRSDCDRAKPVTFYACGKEAARKRIRKKKGIKWAIVGELADYWLAQKADRSLFFFQKFKSMIAYATTIEEHYSYEFFKVPCVVCSDDLIFAWIRTMFTGQSGILSGLVWAWRPGWHDAQFVGVHSCR